MSVVRRSSTTMVSQPGTACFGLQLRRASSSASTERRWWTSRPGPTCRPRRSTTTSAGRWNCSITAARWELARLAPGDTSMVWAAPDVVRAFLSPEFRSTRRLLAEIHVAAARHPEVAALLAEWHTENGGQVGLDVRNGRRRSGQDVLRPPPGSLPDGVTLRAAGSPDVTGAVRRDARHRSLSMRSKS